MAYERQPDEVGVLFKKESKAGKAYWSGTLNGQEVVGFPRSSANGSERIELKLSKPRDGAPPQRGEADDSGMRYDGPSDGAPF